MKTFDARDNATKQQVRAFRSQMEHLASATMRQNDKLEHVAQKWEPVLRFSDMRNQKDGAGLLNQIQRDPLWMKKALARQAGSATSDAKPAAAARANGRKGGRPRGRG